MHRLFACLALLLLLFWCGFPAVAGTRFDDVVIDVEIMPDGETGHGYLEYVFSLQNTSPVARQVQLLIPQSRGRYGSYYEHLREISRTVVVGPMARATVSLFQPPFEVYGDNAGVVIDGRKHLDSLALPHSRHGYPWPSYRIPHLLVSQRLPEDLRRLLQEPEALKTSYSSRQINIMRSDVPVSQWSKTWLGYTRYDGIAIHNSDIESMPAEIFAALWRYVECGGMLLVIGAWRPQGYGAPHTNLHGVAGYYVGFGECLNIACDTMTELEGQNFDEVRALLWKISEKLRAVKSVAEANEAFAVVDKIDTPLRGLFVLMLLFAILIGPVNLGFLNRRQKKIWMLWTVPLISFVTCLLVFVYALAAEGWSGQSRQLGITMLDERSQRATTIGWTAFYSPLTPGDGLHFSYDIELMAQVNNSGYSYRDRSNTPRTIDWSQEQHLQSGWITARVPAHFTLRKSQTGMAALLRLTVSEEQGQITVGNSLGGRIRELWLADSAGAIHHGEDIMPGQKVRLTRADNVKAGGQVSSWRAVFFGDWLEMATQLTQAPHTFLRAGCYLAVLDSSPFIEEGLAKAKRRDARAIVYGIRKGAANED